MSRIGKVPISIGNGVEVKFSNNTVTVKGPKGVLTQEVHKSINIEINEGLVTVNRKDDQKQSMAYHGLYRSLISNMIQGVSEGFKRSLEINGVGYKAEKKDKVLNLVLGYSHPIDYTMPEGIDFNIENNGRLITVMGIDKQLVGQVAANIRQFRKPEPYKGKGIKYSDETILRKEGKTKK
jgi:large subunit ribosomal protein L6